MNLTPADANTTVTSLPGAIGALVGNYFGTSKIGAAAKALGQEFGKRTDLGIFAAPFVNPAETFVFPNALKERLNSTSSSNHGRPAVVMTCHETRNGQLKSFSITLPIPMGLQVADMSSFGKLDLGVVGGAVNDALSSGSSQGAVNSIKKTAGGISSTFDGRNVLDFFSGALGKFSFLGRADRGAGFAAGVAENENSVINFSGVGMRSFSFAYKLVPHSRDEAQTIKKIHESFRRAMYPTPVGYQLGHPPQWTIRFVDLGTGQDLEYVPKLWASHLVSMSATFNSSTNLWMEDNSPIETDLSITFSEKKQLLLEDIIALETAPLFSPLQTSSAKSPIAAITSRATNTVTKPSQAPSNSQMEDLDNLRLPDPGTFELGDGVLPPRGSI